jgi:hypothetical protein
VLAGGISWRWTNRVTLVADISLPTDHDASLHAGGEYTLPAGTAGRVILRGGFKTDRIADLNDAMGAITAGLGFVRGIWGVDYALVPYGPLGMTHLFTFNLRFSGKGAASSDQRSGFLSDQTAEDSSGGADFAGSGADRRFMGNPQDMYRRALEWLDAKTAAEKLTVAEQIQLLEKIQAKFQPLGADVSAGDARLRALKK